MLSGAPHRGVSSVGSGRYTALMTRPQLVDCPECACLIAVDEKACPFCGAAPRRYAVSSVLGIGFMLGLATASCGEKEPGTESSTAMTSSDGTFEETMVGGGTAYAGPSATSTEGNEATGSAYAGPTDTTIASSVAYAGPPETVTEMGGTSAYAGPASESTASDTDDTDTDSDTTGTSTSTSTSTSTGTGTDTGSTSPVLPGDGG